MLFPGGRPRPRHRWCSSGTQRGGAAEAGHSTTRPSMLGGGGGGGLVHFRRRQDGLRAPRGPAPASTRRCCADGAGGPPRQRQRQRWRPVGMGLGSGPAAAAPAVRPSALVRACPIARDAIVTAHELAVRPGARLMLEEAYSVGGLTTPQHGRGRLQLELERQQVAGCRRGQPCRAGSPLLLCRTPLPLAAAAVASPVCAQVHHPDTYVPSAGSSMRGGGSHPYRLARRAADS